METLCARRLCGEGGPNNLMMTINEITEAIIGSSIEVHRELGPGLRLIAMSLPRTCASRNAFPL